MFSERTTLRLKDIVENAECVAEYIDGMSYAQFQSDRKTIDAVERCLSRISEAVVQIGEDQVAEARLGVSLGEMRGLGNRLRHEYRRVDRRVIYDAARDDVPALCEAAARALTAP